MTGAELDRWLRTSESRAVGTVYFANTIGAILGSLLSGFVLIRLISIPDEFLPADGRGIGIWIALVGAIGVIFGGLLRAGEEL